MRRGEGRREVMGEKRVVGEEEGGGGGVEIMYRREGVYIERRQEVVAIEVVKKLWPLVWGERIYSLYIYIYYVTLQLYNYNDIPL